MKNILTFCLLTFFIFGCNESKQTSHVEVKNSIDEKSEKLLPKLEANRYNVAFLIMDGVYNTELTAPFDIFQHTIFRDNIKAMNVFRRQSHD